MRSAETSPRLGRARRRGQNLPPEPAQTLVALFVGVGALAGDALWRWRRHRHRRPAIGGGMKIAVAERFVYPTSSQRGFWVKA